MAQTEKDVSREEQLAELEFKLRIFEDGVKSPFWKTLAELWKPLVDSATGAALSGTATDRGFLAGKANGLHNFLTFPEKHIKRLQNEIKMKSSMIRK